MKLIKEKVDEEFFIDVVLTQNEIKKLQDQYLIAGEFEFAGTIINIGVRPEMKGDNDASYSRFCQEDDF
jgi:hypothetical protein